MRNVVCPHCHQTVQVPLDLERAHCVHCGKLLRALETNVTASPHQAIQPAAYSASMAHRDQLSQSDASWEEFRSTSPAVQRELMNLAMRAMPDLRPMETIPLPESVPAKIDGWSRPLGSINIPGANPLYSLIAALLFLNGGILTFLVGVGLTLRPPLEFGQPNREIGPTIAFFGIMGSILGLALRYFNHTNSTASPATLWIFEEGLFLNRYEDSRAVFWDEVKNFRTSTETGRPIFWLTLARGVSTVISFGHAPQVIPLMEYVEVRLTASQFLKRLHLIWTGHREQFGVVWFDREGIEGPHFFAPWPTVRRVMTDPRHLFVDWNGSKEWSSLRHCDVSFPHLVMAIAHVLIDEHQRFPKVDA